jgi:hypothetical protein
MDQQAHQDAKQQQQQQQIGDSASTNPQTTTSGVQDAAHRTAGPPPGHHSAGSTYQSRASGATSAAQHAHEPGLPFGGKQRKPQRPDMLVLDLPWIYHWPKFLLWLLFEGCHIALAVGESLFHNERECVTHFANAAAGTSHTSSNGSCP